MDPVLFAEQLFSKLKDELKTELDNGCKKFKDAYVKELCENELTYEYDIKSDKDNIKGFTILCRYPLVLEKCKYHPSDEKCYRYFMTETILSKDEYLLAILDNNELHEEYTYSCTQKYKYKQCLRILTNKRIVQLFSSYVKHHNDYYTHIEYKNDFIITRFHSGSSNPLISKYLYDKIEHCLIVSSSGLYYPTKDDVKIYHPEMNYTLPLSYINMIINVYNQNYDCAKSIIQRYNRSLTSLSVINDYEKKLIDINKKEEDLEKYYLIEEANLKKKYNDFDIYCEEKEKKLSQELENKKTELEDYYRKKEVELLFEYETKLKKYI